MLVYLEPNVRPLFLKVPNPPKQGPNFQSKQGAPFGFVIQVGASLWLNGLAPAKKECLLKVTTIHMSQGRSTPCIGDGRPPTFNRESLYL